MLGRDTFYEKNKLLMYLKVVLLQKRREVEIICDFVFPVSKDTGQLLYKP